MQLIRDFFQARPSQPPQLGLSEHLFLFLALLLVVYVSVAYGQSSRLQKGVRILQACQLCLLYGWYIAIATPISASLPLYHCRTAMFVLLFLKGRSIYKEYFALIGIFGSICALVYPVFDPFPWFHVTIFSFIIGHIALLGNSLIYLSGQDSYQLTGRKIVELTFAYNSFILVVDILTGGDYGFLRNLPILGNYGLFWNYLIESILFILILATFLKFFQALQKTKKSR